MIHLVVCTHSRHDLVAGAIASVRRYATDAIHVTVLDSSGTLGNVAGAEVVHVRCSQYHHTSAARAISTPDEVTVCIDDDVRLVSHVSLADRYRSGWWKPLNGHMVQAWTGPRVSDPYSRMAQWRVASQCIGLPRVLCGYASASTAEQIDGIWLHIDKGSTAPTAERDALIRYLDHGAGVGDIVAAGLAAVGITKERVSAVLGKPCNCGQRQQALNALGRRLGIG